MGGEGLQGEAGPRASGPHLPTIQHSDHYECILCFPQPGLHSMDTQLHRMSEKVVYLNTVPCSPFSSTHVSLAAQATAGPCFSQVEQALGLDSGLHAVQAAMLHVLSMRQGFPPGSKAVPPMCEVRVPGFLT